MGRLARTDTAEAYVRRSIVNASVSGWRKHRHLLTVEDPEPLAREHRADPSAGVSDADHAWALVGTLPTRQRAAVVLRFYEDLSFVQIALILDCPKALLAPTCTGRSPRCGPACPRRTPMTDPDARAEQGFRDAFTSQAGAFEAQPLAAPRGRRRRVPVLAAAAAVAVLALGSGLVVALRSSDERPGPSAGPEAESHHRAPDRRRPAD